MEDKTNTINVLVLNGAKFELDKIRNISGPLIEVKRTDINADVNMSDISTGLHLLTVARALPGKEQFLHLAKEYEAGDTEPMIVVKSGGKLLLLSGHKTFNRSQKSLLAVRLITTVGMKDKAKIHPPAEPTTVGSIPVTPSRNYPAEFKNTVRFDATPNRGAKVGQRPETYSRTKFPK